MRFHWREIGPCALFGILLVLGILAVIVGLLLFILYSPVKRFVFKDYGRRFREIESGLPKLALYLRERREKLERCIEFCAPYDPYETPESVFARKEATRIHRMELRVNRALVALEGS